jgi:hypothetical protein
MRERERFWDFVIFLMRVRSTYATCVRQISTYTVPMIQRKSEMVGPTSSQQNWMKTSRLFYVSTDHSTTFLNYQTSTNSSPDKIKKLNDKSNTHYFVYQAQQQQPSPTKQQATCSAVLSNEPPRRVSRTRVVIRLRSTIFAMMRFAKQLGTIEICSTIIWSALGKIGTWICE